MFRQILIPTENNHNVALPTDLYGKKVEVIAFELTEEKNVIVNTGAKNFLDDIEIIPDFPSIDSIRKDSWPQKW